MTRLWLVRHGQPDVDRAAPAHEWQLEPGAGRDITRLRPHLPVTATWASSSEPKALGTARLLTDAPVREVDALRELIRPAVWRDGDRWDALVRRAVSVPDVPAAEGWEAAASAQARVGAAVRRLVAPHPDHLVLVGHGLAWTLLVAALTDARPDLDTWASMRMPDVAMLEVTDTGAARLVREWGTGQDWWQPVTDPCPETHG